MIFIFSWGVIAGVLCFCSGILPIKADLIDKSIDFKVKNLGDNLVVVQENSLIAVNNFQNPEVKKVMNVIATAYSSSPEETDGDPFTTASGTKVREEIIANNLLPFGTKVRIPELYGEKIFVVEDRMHWRKSHYQIDIWFPSKQEAKEFGAKRTYIEVLEG